MDSIVPVTFLHGAEKRVLEIAPGMSEDDFLRLARTTFKSVDSSTVITGVSFLDGTLMPLARVLLSPHRFENSLVRLLSRRMSTLADKDTAVLRFHLDGEDDIVIEAGDVEGHAAVVHEAKFKEWGFRDVLQTLMQQADSSGRLTMSAYSSAIQVLLRGVGGEKSLDKVTRSRVNAVLQTVYRLLQRSSSSVDARELATCLAVFCGGTKSEKLGEAFSLFDADGDWKLTRRQMLLFLRAFLSALFAVPLSAKSFDVADARNRIDAAVTASIRHIFSLVARPDEQGRITFEDFAAWYNEDEGGSRVPWLELLDPSKWPGSGRMRTMASVPISKGAAPPPVPQTQPQDADQEDTTLYFPVADDGTVLSITPSTALWMRNILTHTRFSELEPEAVVKAVRSASNGAPTMTKKVFTRTLRFLVRASGAPKTREAVAALKTLGHMFSWFPASENGHPLVRDVACALLLFSGGAKSEKLAAAFDVMDEDRKDSLTPPQMYTFFRAFLIGIVAAIQLSMFGKARDLPADMHVVETGCVIAKSRVLAHTRKNRVQFSDLADWYLVDESNVAHWLELLDNRKWNRALRSPAVPSSGPFVVEEASETSTSESEKEVGDVDMEDGVEEVSDFPDGDVLVFSFPLPYTTLLNVEGAEAAHAMGSPSARPQAADALCFKERDCIVAAAVSRGTGLATLPPAEVFARFLSQAPSRRLSHAAFQRAFKRLVRQGMSVDEQTVASVVFGQLWLACVGADGDEPTADAITVATAASVLTWGSKSSKLSLAFDYFDTEGEGFLSVSQLSAFIGAILRGILSLRADAWRVVQWVDEIAVDTAKCVFAFSNRSKRDTVSFDEFASWYNAMGVHVVPWIELLDMNKWPRPVVSDFSRIARLQLQAASLEQEGEQGEEEEEEEEEEDVSGEEAGQVAIIVDKDSDAALSINQEQAAGLRRLAGKVRDDLQHGETFDLAYEIAPRGTMNMKDHLSLLRQLMPSLKMDPDDVDVLAAASLHAALREDLSLGDSVPVTDLVTAVLLLLPGSKSDKLAAAWNAFTQPGSNTLTALDLSRLLHAFLLGLHTLASSWADEDDELNKRALLGIAPGREEDALNEICMKLTLEVLAWTGKEDEASPRITFEEFGEWYNEGGYEHAPWIELLDITKWAIMTASSESGRDEVESVLDMPLVNDADSISKSVRLIFTDNCIQELNTTVTLSQLCNAKAEQVIADLQGASRNGTLNQDQFHEALRSLVSGDSLDKEARAFLSLVFTNMFYAYDRENVGDVDLADIAAGFLMLCQGSKSEKLAAAFELFDEDMDGRLEKPSFWRFVRSFLTMLMWVIASDVQGDKDTIDIAAWEITKLVFVDTDSSRRGEDSISFEEFGEWYNGGGYSVIPWLELLNLERWPGIDLTAASPAVATSSKEVARFQLNDAGESVTITEDDRNRLETLLKTTQFGRMDPDEVIATFEQNAQGGTLDKASFDRAIRALVPGRRLTREEKAFLSFALSNIFYAFDRDSNGVVDLAEFLAGFTLLSSGGKSDKLALAFRLFDEDGDGYISREEMERYLRAFLTVLVALQDGAQSASMSDLLSLVSSSAAELTQKVFADADANNDGRISFEEFGEWYNRGGYEVVPWLELLNLKKWGMNDEPGAFDAAEEAATRDETTIPAGDATAAPVFVFQGLPSIGNFEVTAGAVAFVRRLLRTTGLSTLTIESVAEMVASASVRGEISPEAFEDIVARITPIGDSLSRITSDDQTFRVQALLSLFFAFDREGSGSVSAKDFAAGLCMLAAGRKSSKLNLAWQLFDEDTDGYLTLSQFQSFIASFLTTLVCVRDQAGEGDGGLESDVLIEKASRALAIEVFAAVSANDDTSRSAINFDEFGQWYNSGGFSSAPWLELLELRKWALAKWAGGSNLQNVYSARRIAKVGAQVIGGDSAKSPGAERTENESPVPTRSAAPEGPADPLLISALLPGEQNELKALNFHASDILRLNTLLVSSGLSSRTVDDVVNVVPKFAEDGTFELVTWFTAVQELAKSEWTSVASKRIFVDTITQIFDCMGGQATGAIDAAEATTALLMLVQGSKSEKLPPAFLACARSGNGENGSSIGATVESSFLGELGLWRFFRAMLVVLAVLSREKRQSEHYPRDIDVDTPAMLLMHEVMDAVGEPSEDEGTRRVSYSDFVDWYNRFGYSKMPWIELLDLNKWVLNDDLREAATKAVTSGQDTAVAEEVLNEEVETKESEEPSDDSLLFRFVISDRGDTIIVTRSDYELLQRLLSTSALGQFSSDQLVEAFDAYAQDGALSLDGFHRAIRQMISGDALNSKERAFLSIALSKIFNAFDRDGNEVVDFAEFMSGFSLLSRGGKSDKLSLAFSLFDEDGDGYISKAEMWRFLRSFLTILYTLSSHEYASDPQRLVTTAALELTKIVFADADTNHDGRISFDEFGEWYNAGGFEVMPWLELLDIQKWRAKREEIAAHKGKGEKESPVIFQFPLYPDATSSTSLVVTEAVRDKLDAVLEACGLQEHSLNIVKELFEFATKDTSGVLHQQDYDVVIRELLSSVKELPAAAQEEISEAFENAFAIFDIDGDGFVRVAEFFAGFSILCSGSKSEKLAAAFSLFDEKERGSLSKTELWRYLRSFLRMLLVLQSGLNDVSEASLAEATEISNNVAWSLVRVIMDDASPSTEGQLTFEEFGTWYNSGGHEMMAWLELLDFNKWRRATPLGGVSDEEESEEADDVLGTAGNSIALKVPVMEGYDSLLVYTERDLERLKSILRVSGLNEFLPAELSNVILDNSSDNGQISKDGFDAAVRTLIPGAYLTSAEKRLLSVGLSLLYYGYEQEDSGVVAVDLATGISVLGSGSKSDKLSSAWRFFDEDGDGKLEKSEFFRFVRAFITPLAMLQNSVAEAPLNTLSRVLDAVARHVTAEVFTEADTDAGQLSYDSFGEWYNQGGYKAAAWLELLDLKKWVLSDKQLEAQNAGATETENEEEEEGAEDNRLVFQFPLKTRAGESQAELSLSDCMNMGRIIELTMLDTIFCEHLYESLYSTNLGDQVGFGDALRALEPLQLTQSLSQTERKWLRGQFQAVFKGIAGGRESISVPELAAGFSVFLGGSKSDKLSAAFQAFGEERNGETMLNVKTLSLFFNAFLGSLCSLMASSSSISSDIIREVALELASEVVSSSGKKEVIAYTDLGQWYNNGGFQVAPWIELLDLNKWPGVLSSQDEEEDDEAGEDSVDDGDYDEESAEGDSADEDSDPYGDDDNDGVAGEEEGSGGEEEGEMNPDDEEGVVPQDHLQSRSAAKDEAGEEYTCAILPSVSFVLGAKDCNKLRAVGAASGLSSILPTDEEASRFFGGSDATATLKEMSEEDFFGAVKRVLRWDSLGHSDAVTTMTFMRDLYNQLAAVYKHLGPNKEESGSSTTPRGVDLWAALMLLFDGTKSQKLTTVFIHASRASSSGSGKSDLLPAYSLQRLIAALLCPLVTVKFGCVDGRAEEVASAAVHVTATALQEYFSEDNKGEMSYEEFGDWYNRGGHRSASWLELLDLKKWLSKQ